MKPRTTPRIASVGVSVFLHVLILATAGRIGFGVSDRFADDMLVAVTPSFEGEPVAWVARGAQSVAFAAEPSVVTDALAELEPELPDSFANEPSERVVPEAASADLAAEIEEAHVAPVELVEPDVFALGELSLASAETSRGADADGDASPGSLAGEPGERSKSESRAVGENGAAAAAAGSNASGGSAGSGSPGRGGMQGVDDARLVEAPPPVYPRLSVRAGEEGTVRCRLHLAADGHVVSVDVVESSGYPRLDRAAVEALLDWRFHPRRLDDPATILHQVTFRLEES